jgi:hypothetical protein
VAEDHSKNCHSDHLTYSCEELSRVKKDRCLPQATGEDRERRYRIQSVSHINYTRIPTSYTPCTTYCGGMGEYLFRFGESGRLDKCTHISLAIDRNPE